MLLPPNPYPPTPKSNVLDNYHGTPVPASYRWFEDIDNPK